MLFGELLLKKTEGWSLKFSDDDLMKTEPKTASQIIHFQWSVRSRSTADLLMRPYDGDASKKN